MHEKVRALVDKRNAILKQIKATFQRSDDPHPKHRRAILTHQSRLLDQEIMRVSHKNRKRKANEPGLRL
jgi:hypothetical protein